MSIYWRQPGQVAQLSLASHSWDEILPGTPTLLVCHTMKKACIKNSQGRCRGPKRGTTVKPTRSRFQTSSGKPVRRTPVDTKTDVDASISRATSVGHSLQDLMQPRLDLDESTDRQAPRKEKRPSLSVSADLAPAETLGERLLLPKSQSKGEGPSDSVLPESSLTQRQCLGGKKNLDQTDGRVYNAPVDTLQGSAFTNAQNTRTIQRDIGFEFQTYQGNTKFMDGKIIYNDHAEYTRPDKSWLISNDGGDLEIVTHHFPETKGGKESMTQALRDTIQWLDNNKGDGKAKPKIENSGKTLSKAGNNLGDKINLNIDDEVIAHPQATAGLPLDKLYEFIEKLYQKRERTPKEEENFKKIRHSKEDYKVAYYNHKSIDKSLKIAQSLGKNSEALLAKTQTAFERSESALGKKTKALNNASDSLSTAEGAREKSDENLTACITNARQLTRDLQDKVNAFEEAERAYNATVELQKLANKAYRAAKKNNKVHTEKTANSAKYDKDQAKKNKDEAKRARDDSKKTLNATKRYLNKLKATQTKAERLHKRALKEVDKLKSRLGKAKDAEANARKASEVAEGKLKTTKNVAQHVKSINNKEKGLLALMTTYIKAFKATTKASTYAKNATPFMARTPMRRLFLTLDPDDQANLAKIVEDDAGLNVLAHVWGWGDVEKPLLRHGAQEGEKRGHYKPIGTDIPIKEWVRSVCRSNTTETQLKKDRTLAPNNDRKKEIDKLLRGYDLLGARIWKQQPKKENLEELKTSLVGFSQDYNTDIGVSQKNESRAPGAIVELRRLRYGVKKADWIAFAEATFDLVVGINNANEEESPET